MGFLKRHYEKILLSVVLLGLCGAAAWMPVSIGKVRGQLTAIAPFPSGGAALPPVAELPTLKKAAEESANPPPVILSGEHNLFTPVTWKLMPDGSLKKFTVEGVAALRVTKITPLFTTITWVRTAGTSYQFQSQQHATGRGLPQSDYLRMGEINRQKFFKLVEMQGPADNPTAVVVDVLSPAQGAPVTLKMSNEWRTVDSYVADLYYPVDNQSIPNNRVTSTFKLGDESFKIIAITNNAVKVKSNSTGSETTVSPAGAP